jgi:hypothetical protein
MDEQIRFMCSNPACGKRLKAPPEHAGKRARCSCGQAVLVPFPESVPAIDYVPEEAACVSEEFDEIRNEFYRIAETYLNYSSEAGRSPIPLLKDKELIRLLLPLFCEENDTHIRPAKWVKPQLGQFMQRFDRAFQEQSLENRLAKAKRWHHALTEAKDLLFAQYQEENAEHVKRCRSKDMWFNLGLLLGVCILGVAAGLARAQVFPWYVAIIIIAAYVTVYISISFR